MERIQHPGYVLGTGKPGVASLAPAYKRKQADIGDDGYFEVEDEHAPAIKDRLAETYEVEFDGEDVVVPDDHPTLAAADVDEGEDEETAEADDTHASADSSYSKADLEALKQGELKEIFDDLGGDREEVNMTKNAEIIAGILRLQADNEEA